ncbi:MAG: IS5 family transposase [Flavobacteriales bacterium]|nr:IS5 family transposase [Flavobacteriales bacterium]
MNKKRPLPGLFDAQQRGAKLTKLNDVLVRLKTRIDWEGFGPVVEACFPARDPSKGGQPPYDRLLLFKMLVLCRLYHLSAEALEFQVNDRKSFQDFLDLEPQHEVPDATTVRLFAKRLMENGTMPKLFAHFRGRLQEAGLVINEGKIIDASIVDAPVQRNSREANQQIKNNDMPEDWSEHKRRQKDVDATWTQKHGKNHFGYKNHLKVDAGSKLIDHYVVTTASTHDGTMVWDLLTEEDKGQELHGDKAYDSAHTKQGVRLARMKCRVLKSARRGKPLTARQKRTNTERSRVRARIEHVFGAMDKQLGGLRVRCVGLNMASFHVGLTNLCYNMLRTLTLLPQHPSVGSV